MSGPALLRRTAASRRNMRMTIIDRYVLRLFIKVLMVCFLSLSGLFIIVDAFGNLDEFLSIGKVTEGGWMAVMLDYYSPRVLTFFDRTSALLVLIAGIFAITWLQRSNELTAIMAAGINAGRVIRPLIMAAIVVSLLAVANRECFVPMVRDKLTRNAQDWLGRQHKPVRPKFDHQTNILVGGRHTVASERKIVDANFRLFTRWGNFGRQLVANEAIYHPPTADRPGGYLLNDVKTPEDMSLHPSVQRENQPVILSPVDTSWLNANQCFVATGVDFDHLANGPTWRQFSSSAELLAGMRNPSLDYGTDVRVDVHSRMVQPFLDMTLLFLGLPLALTRENRNIFYAAGMCLFIVANFYIVVLVCHALGTSGIVKPAFAAWCPLIIFAPFAMAISQSLRES